MSRRRVLRDVRLRRLPELQRPVLHNPFPRCGIPRKRIRAVHHREIRQADLVRVAVHHRWHAEVQRSHVVVRDLQFVVAAVVQFRPLQFAVECRQEVAGVVGPRDGDVLSRGAGARHGGAGEFDAHATFARLRVVVVLVEPDQVADPIGVRVAGDDDVVADVVLVECLECPVTVGLVAVPGILDVVSRVYIESVIHVSP